MVVSGDDIQFQLDGGATVNVLPVREYKKVSGDPELKELKPRRRFSVCTMVARYTHLSVQQSFMNLHRPMSFRTSPAPRGILSLMERLKMQ